MASILVIDDDTDICTLLKGYLQRKDHKVETAYSAKRGMALLEKQRFDVVLCDFRLPDGEGVDILNRLKAIHSDARVIIITGYSDVKVAINCIKRGAVDYVTKPLHPEEILVSIKKALEDQPEIPVEVASRDTNTAQKTKKPTKPVQTPKTTFIEGCSPQSLQVKKLVDLVGPTEMSVMVIGETGTGKEFIARSIHNISARVDHPFIAIDCGALPKEIAASELFGHKKGSFTGALADKVGSFQLAQGGTLFLDEIANLSYENQVKLLRVIQERKVRPIGADSDIDIDVRIVVATNENLWKKAKSGTFREDLYHRLNEFSIELSPLRERQPEIMQFAEHFIEESNAFLDRNVKSISDSACEKLKKYYWHGNLRELKNVIKRAVLLTPGEEIDTAQLPIEIVNAMPEMGADHGNGQEVFSTDGSLKQVAERAERQAILQALKRTNYNKSKTAEILDVDRKTLYNKINAYGINLKR